ncbi:MAG: ATP-binding protein, partial [Comamonas sp.]
LVRQILNFARNDKPERRPLQVHEVMQDTARLLRVSLPPAIELQIEQLSPLPLLMADPTQVEQALFNLCSNAMQAMGEARGCIQMQAQLLRPERQVCERLGLTWCNYILLTVQDNGPGMDEATQQRIFEPFFTTKAVGQGTGLGLAVVHGVMRTHGGAVDVFSAPGLGSRFNLFFPLPESEVLLEPQAHSTAAAAPHLAPAAHEAHANAACHVMYVDDDQALVFLVQRLLRRRGYVVSGFTDPHEAVQALRDQPQDFDLVVTDYNMPGYSGLDLVVEALEIRPGLPIALASGYVTAEIENAALAAGAKALIYKPNDVEELCATVHRLLHERD